MIETIALGGTTVHVIRKHIKHVYLRVYPPTGQVQISVPKHMAQEAIRTFTMTKWPWIQAQQRKIAARPHPAPHQFIHGESHPLWGQQHLLTVVECETTVPHIDCQAHQMALVLYVRPGTSAQQRGEWLEGWYRAQVRAAVLPLLKKWEPLMGVKSSRVSVQRMTTRWGSCTPSSKAIRLNTVLAQKPPECLEYVLVHELAHLLEPSHNARFVSIMDCFMPQWRQLRAMLNHVPTPQQNGGQ